MEPSPKLIVLTGLSGSGKKRALRFFEDFGYDCVDNLPAGLIPAFAQHLIDSGEKWHRTVILVDARSGSNLRKLPQYLNQIKSLGVLSEVIFLETSDQVLKQRYSESRRPHPSSPNGSVDEGILFERELLAPIRAQAAHVFDTTTFSISELHERIAEIFATNDGKSHLVVSVMSFGFKYGLPPEADLVIDVRFLPNPYYDTELRPMSGEAPEVREYVLNNDSAQEFMAHLKSMLKFLVPKYAEEPKSYLTIAVGCTGGRHRSVVMAREMVRILRGLQFDARLRDRDINRSEID